MNDVQSSTDVRLSASAVTLSSRTRKVLDEISSSLILSSKIKCASTVRPPPSRTGRAGSDFEKGQAYVEEGGRTLLHTAATGAGTARFLGSGRKGGAVRFGGGGFVGCPSRAQKGARIGPALSAPGRRAGWPRSGGLSEVGSRGQNLTKKAGGGRLSRRPPGWPSEMGGRRAGKTKRRSMSYGRIGRGGRSRARRGPSGSFLRG